MDMMQTVIEAVLISFFVGAILGAIVAVHMTSKRPEEETRKDVEPGNLEMKRVKVKTNNRDSFKF